MAAIDYETIIVGATRAGLALAVALIDLGRDDLTLLAAAPPDDPDGLVAARDLTSYLKTGAALATATWLDKRDCWEIAIEGAQLLTARCLVDAGEGAVIPPHPRRFEAASEGVATHIAVLHDALDAAEAADREA